jgi:hypothetical protein
MQRREQAAPIARRLTFFLIEADRLPERRRRANDIDAFSALRQLVLTLQDQVLVGLAIREAEDPREMRGATSNSWSARAIRQPRVRDLFAVRNRLAHLYPRIRLPGANLNAAYQAAPLAGSERAGWFSAQPEGTLSGEKDSYRAAQRATSPLGQAATSPETTAPRVVERRPALVFGAHRGDRHHPFVLTGTAGMRSSRRSDRRL